MEKALHTHTHTHTEEKTQLWRDKLRRDNADGISGTIRTGAAVVACNCTTCCAIFLPPPSLQSYIILAPSSITPSSIPLSSGVDNRRFDSIFQLHFFLFLFPFFSNNTNNINIYIHERERFLVVQSRGDIEKSRGDRAFESLIRGEAAGAR